MNGYEPTDAGGLSSSNGGGILADAPTSVARRLTEYHRRRSGLFEWMHPHRFAALPYADVVRGLHDGRVSVLAEAFLNAAGMRAPPLAAFVAPDAALAVLTMPECLAVFRLRALLEHANEVHSWLDRPHRALLKAWLGPHGVRWLLARRRELHDDVGCAPQAVPLGPLSADELAWRGFRLFECECGWPANGPVALAQFALPDDATGEAPFAARRGPAQWNPSLSIVAQLPDLFPEGSW